MRRPLIGLAALLVLAGCRRAPEPAGAVTADEQARLNAAAALLDSNAESRNAADDETPTAGNKNDPA